MRTDPIKAYLAEIGAKGGAAGKGAAKARPSAQARAAIQARWAKLKTSNLTQNPAIRQLPHTPGAHGVV